MSAAMETATMTEDNKENGQAPGASNAKPMAPMGRAGSQGARKAAIAMMMLGPELASEILRVLGDNEVKILLETANRVKRRFFDCSRPWSQVKTLEPFLVWERRWPEVTFHFIEKWTKSDFVS